MPTILSHAAVPLAMGLALGRRNIPPLLLVAGVGAALLPDLDVVGLVAGIPYGHVFGHRGASHSIAAAALVGLLGATLMQRSDVPFARACLFLFAAAASHGLLDMLTDGGLGVAFFWPLSEARLFAPWRPIQVSPLALRDLLSVEGLEVAASEAVWILLPAALAAAWWRRLRGAARVPPLDKHP